MLDASKKEEFDYLAKQIAQYLQTLLRPPSDIINTAPAGSSTNDHETYSTGTWIARIPPRPGGPSVTHHFQETAGHGVVLNAESETGLGRARGWLNTTLSSSGLAFLRLSDDAVDDNAMIERVWDNVVFRIDLDGPRGPGGASSNNVPNWGLGERGFDLRALWNRGTRGRGVRIGIADSGIDIGHPAFAKLRERDGLKAFAHFDKLGQLVSSNASAPTYSHWHGTHCAAVLVGNETDGNVRGIAEEAELVVAQILNNQNEGSVASFKAGFHWLATQRCDVVSLSVGWAGEHEEWADEIQQLVDNGTVVVAASGNEYPSPRTRSPGNYPPCQ